MPSHYRIVLPANLESSNGSLLGLIALCLSHLMHTTDGKYLLIHATGSLEKLKSSCQIISLFEYTHNAFMPLPIGNALIATQWRIYW